MITYFAGERSTLDDPNGEIESYFEANVPRSDVIIFKACSIAWVVVMLRPFEDS